MSVVVLTTTSTEEEIWYFSCWMNAKDKCVCNYTRSQNKYVRVIDIMKLLINTETVSTELIAMLVYI